MDDLQKQVEALKILYLAMPTINYGPAQFNDEWNPNSQYYFDLYKQQTTHSVTYNGGYYILTDVPNGLPPDTDHAWKLVGTTGNSTLGNFKGFYDAATNTPPLVNGVGQSGDYYIVKVPGDATPSGEYADANDTIACNDLLMWEVGPAVSSTDSIVVSNNYSVLDNTDVQKGQTVTTALGALQGRINAILVTQAQQTTQITTLEQDINALDALILTKQDLIPSAVNNNLAKFVNGQVQDSGIVASAVTTQGNNINVAGGLVKTDGNNAIVSAINISNAFTLVNANYQGTLASVLSQIIGTIPSPYTLPIATPTVLGGSMYPASGALTVNEFGQVGVNVDGTSIKIVNDQLVAVGDGTGTVTKVSSSNTDIDVQDSTTTPVLTLNSSISGAANKIVKLNELGQLGAIDIGTNGLAISPKTGTEKTLNQALADAYTSIPDIEIANTAFVGKNGTAQGTGAINNLYPTIQAAIDASPANTQIFVYASGLGTGTAYNENLNLKASQVITGASSQFVVIAGTVNTPTTGGTCYLENLRIQVPSGNGNVINFLNSTSAMNLQLNNVDINLWGGTGSCVNWLNTNANSKILCDGVSAWNVISSANGAKLFTSGAGTAGQVILQNVSAQINDNINNVAYSIGGAVRFYHTLDNVYGQIQVANTATFTGTFLTIYTGNVAAMVTNSTGLSSLNSVVMTTTANATAGTAVVEGAGGFAFFQTATPNTSTKGFATTLNSGVGAVSGATYSMRLDSSGIAPFTAGVSDGLIQYDGGNFFVDTLLARFKLVTADNTTNKVLGTWLPNGENSNSVNIPLSVNLLPLNGLRTVTNSSTTTAITISLPTNYVYTSTAYGNSTTALSLPPKASVTLMCTAVNTAPTNSTVAIVGFALAQGSSYTLPAATATTLGGSIYPASSAFTVDANGNVNLKAATASILGGVKIPANVGIVVDAQGNLGLNYNQQPVYSATSASDVISSQALFYALSNLAGTNLTYSNGKLNANTSPSGSKASAQYSNFESGALIAPGKLNIGSSTVKYVTNLVEATGVEMPLIPNADFNIMAVLNVNCANQPSHGVTDLQYRGTTDTPPTYAISTNNCQIANGSIVDGVFIGSGYNGTISSNPYTTSGLITEYVTTANITSQLCGIGASTTANSWTFYAPTSLSGNASPQSFTTSLLYQSGGALSLNPSVNLTQNGDNKLGQGYSAWSNFTNPVVPSGTYVNEGSCISDRYTVLFGVGNITSVWVSSNTTNTPSWVQSPTFTTLSSGIDSSAIYANNFVSLSRSTANAPHTGVAINLSTNAIIGEFTTTATGAIQQVSVGVLNGNNVFAFVSDRDTVVRWANGNTPTTWNDVSTNILTLVPTITQMKGICYESVRGLWYVTAVNGTNTYVFTSTDLANWELFQTINNLLFGVVKSARLSGIGYTNQSFALVMCSYNSSGTGNTVTYTYTLGQVGFDQVYNVLNLSGTAPTIHPSGLIVLSSSTTADTFNYSYDGVNFATAPANSNVAGLMLPMGNGFIRITSGFAWSYIPITFRYSTSGTQPALPTAIYAWNKTLTINGDPLFIQAYTLEKNGTISMSATIGYSETGFNQISIGLTGVYNGERVNAFGSVINTDTNTFTVKLVGTDASLLASLTQRPSRAGDQPITLLGKCTTNATGNPSVAVQVIFNDGTNSILPNSTITAYQL